MLLLTPSGLFAVEAPYGLTFNEGLINPIGFHDPKSHFSWKLKDNRLGVKQTGYQIQA